MPPGLLTVTPGSVPPMMLVIAPSPTFPAAPGVSACTVSVRVPPLGSTPPIEFVYCCPFVAAKVIAPAAMVKGPALAASVRT
jgi:hypothetical protein